MTGPPLDEFEPLSETEDNFFGQHSSHASPGQALSLYRARGTKLLERGPRLPVRVLLSSKACLPNTVQPRPLQHDDHLSSLE